MRHLLALSLLFSAAFISPAQNNQPSSTFGEVHTPKGDLHILMIFVRYEDKSLMKDDTRWPDSSEEGELPAIAKGEINALFHKDPNSIELIEKQNISDYYFTMSGGKFRLTADVYQKQVPVKYIPLKGNNFFSRQSLMNKAAVKWIEENDPDFDWAKYDQRRNNPHYRYDNSTSGPDRVLDYVIFLHRAPGSAGAAGSHNIKLTNSNLEIKDGHTGITSYRDWKHNLEHFKHEFAHKLYACPHYLGANTADGNKFYTNKGWGMMAAWHAPFTVANAWEQWWLGWLEPQQIEQSGQYRLKDFATGRDAIRMRIPGTRDYVFIENHQKKNHWDEKLFFKDPNQGHPQIAPGLYMYVVAEPGADRNAPYLKPFNRTHANMIKMFNAEGNFDYAFTSDSLHTGYFKCPNIEKGPSNPFAGQNAYQFIRADFNHDGKLTVGGAHGNSDGGGKEQQDIWTEKRDGEPVYTLSATGDENDALQVGDEIGLSGIFPITNHPAYDRKEQRFQPFLINSISIKVVAQEPDGTFILDIKTDDWSVRNEQRWCGNLQLSASTDPQRPDTYLQIEKGAEVTLDQSGTLDRMRPKSGSESLINPTQLVIEANRGLRIKKKGKLIIDRGSLLKLTANAQIVIEKKGQLIVRDGGILKLDEESQLIVKGGGKFIIEQTGKVRKMRDANYQFARRARVSDRR
ncbi:MAG: hypothetical protein AAF206_06060 [Bacteroidota bacterium]